jgi:MerR family transcriptional regulator, heat shock protein HspR
MSAGGPEIGNSHAVYSISVASELSGVDPQMLRVYEQRGLLSPFRTDGGTRRYSSDDLERIAAITSLLEEGLNLAGIGHVLQLQEETRQLADELGELRTTTAPDRREVRRLRRENRDLRAELARTDDSGRPIDARPAPVRPPQTATDGERPHA